VIGLTLLIGLFSYKMVLAFSDYNEEQQKVVDYLKNGEWDEELKKGMSSEETAHLEDVREVMQKLNYVFYAVLLICTVMVTQHYKKKKELGELFLWGGIVAGAGSILIGGLSLISFNWLFTLFHDVFFPQGNWMFEIDSFLIQTFPLNFFIWMLVKILIFSLILASLFILGSIYLRHESD